MGDIGRYLVIIILLFSMTDRNQIVNCLKIEYDIGNKNRIEILKLITERI